MSDRPVDGAVRLRGAGVGSLVGGVVLAAASIASAPYVVAAGTVVVLGVVVALYGRDGSQWFDSRPSIGVVAVGGIGLIEAFGFGFGLDPVLLGGLAVAAGLVDIVLGFLFLRMRRQIGGEKSR